MPGKLIERKSISGHNIKLTYKTSTKIPTTDLHEEFDSGNCTILVGTPITRVVRDTHPRFNGNINIRLKSILSQWELAVVM